MTFFKHAYMDVLFEHEGNISNITITIKPEVAIYLNVGDEIAFTRNCFPLGETEMGKGSNSTNFNWELFSINYYYIADYMDYFIKIYPKEHRMFIKIERKIHTNGNTLQFIARVQLPNELTGK